MKVDDALIDKLARLGMLEFDTDEKEQIKTDMERMLNFVAQLEELDTEGVDPLIFMNAEVNVFRPDEVTEQLTQAQALKNAPKHDSFYFKVPKVIENPDK